MGVLTIFLKKISNLCDEDNLGRSDPYVMFELEKDKWMFDKTLGKHQSSKKKNQCNPEYDESFTFKNVPTTDNMLLHVKGKLHGRGTCRRDSGVTKWLNDLFSFAVMDDDFGLDDQLGGCTIDLEKLGLSGEPTDVEQLIQNKKGEGWFSKRAKIFLQISYTE